MQANTVDFVIYVKDQLDDDGFETLEQRSRAHDGVSAVRHQPNQLHLLVIDYVPSRRTPSAVLTHAVQRIVEARLVDL